MASLPGPPLQQPAAGPTASIIPPRGARYCRAPGYSRLLPRKTLSLLHFSRIAEGRLSRARYTAWTGPEHPPGRGPGERQLIGPSRKGCVLPQWVRTRCLWDLSLLVLEIKLDATSLSSKGPWIPKEALQLRTANGAQQRSYVQSFPLIENH